MLGYLLSTKYMNWCIIVPGNKDGHWTYTHQVDLDNLTTCKMHRVCKFY